MAGMPVYVWVGLTLLGILMSGLLIWLVADAIAALKRCHAARLQLHDVSQDRHAHE